MMVKTSRDMKEAIRIALKEMNLTEVPSVASPLRNQFAMRVYQLMEPYTVVFKVRETKLEDFQ